MTRDSLCDLRSAASLAALLSIVCLITCKVAPQRGGEESKPPDTRIKEAISRAAVAPQFGPLLPAEVTRIGSASVLREPRSAAVDKNPNIYIPGTGNFRVVKLDSSGKEFVSFAL
jgi:hypothetical protein